MEELIDKTREIRRHILNMTTDANGNCEAVLNTTNQTSNLGDATIQACATLASPSQVCDQHTLSFMTNEQIQCDLVDNILKSRSDAEKKYNITSTPSLIINEKKYSAMSYENFEKIIENLIN